MNIGKKLYLGFGLIIAMMAALFAVNAAVVYREHRAKGEVLTALQAVRGMDSIRFQSMQNSLYVRNYLLSGDAREMDALHEGLTKLNDMLQKTSGLALSEQQRAGLARVAQVERDWLENFVNPLIEKRKQVDAGNLTVAELQVFYLQQSPAMWLRKVTEPMEDADRETARALGESMKSDEAATSTTTSVTWVCALLTLALGAGIAFRTSKSITQPLAQLITVAHDIGMKGDMEHTIEITRSDEIGDLARSFNRMVQYLREMAGVSEAIAGGDLTVEIQPRSDGDTLAHAFMRMTEGLRSLVSNVRDSAAQVAGGSSQVADASDESAKISAQASAAIDEVTSTMHEMSINVQNMVRNTQVQASSVSETSASIDQMVTSIQRVADTARALLEISNRSREEVKIGLATMERTTDGLNRINGSIHSSAEIIGSLDHRAEDIGKIIEVIDDLAEQTNLLALNAAIEAARAGEHGLGFAVVADEVRKLAEKSAQSTKEIAELIQSIQREARKAVDNMDRSTSMVEEGLTQGANLSAALTKISGVVTEVYRFAQEIGAATAEQSNGSAQIAKTTTRLNEITNEISSAVEEQAGGAQAVVKAMEKMRELMQQSTSGSTELAASSEQMSKMARSLMQSMDRFVLETAAVVSAARMTERPPMRAAMAAAGRNGH